MSRTTGDRAMAQISEHPKDGQVVGSKEILDSPNVLDPPPRINAPIVTPSVYVDSRGEIHNFEIFGRRLNLLATKGGVMRSGDLHRDCQHDFVFSGRVQVSILEPNGTTVNQVYSKNQYIRIPPYTPHVFYFLEDTVLAEWWDGPFRAWFYKPYRKIVDGTIAVKAKPGRFYHYILSESKSPVEGQSDLFRNLLLGVGIALGFTCGFALGRRR